MKPSLTYLISYLAATACIVAYAVTDHPDRIAYLFAAVIFCINGATAKIIASIAEAKQPNAYRLLR